MDVRTVRQLTTMMDARQEGRTSALHLVVMGPEQFFTYALPGEGQLTIGRAETAEIRLDDPLASRLHARLYVMAGGHLEMEDLGSINRTKVREEQLSPGERVGVVPGEAVTIGSTVLMVQESRSMARPRRIWPHTYFEARLEEECARSLDSRAPFIALRLHVDGDLAPSALAELAAPALRLADMLALYGPSEYEFLLPGATADLGAAIADDLTARLTARGIGVRTGLAAYPTDGRTPEMLLSVACERVRGASGPPDATAAGVVVEDDAMLRLYQMVDRVAAGTINVLIVGETGVGKEILAEAVHKASPRTEAPFVCLNCASLSENLMESELFGHEKGAFTGAAAAKPGLLETAPGGTVFLDEIGEMPMSLQAKVLRVLETRRIARVGSVKEREIDVRFVAATNRDLDHEVAAGRFRRDLYFRLNGITLHIPPLRERRGEIRSLAEMFLRRYCEQLARRPPNITAEALALLEGYAWPGNIRELRNVMERASLLATSTRIEPQHLPVETMLANPALPRAAAVPAVSASRVVPFDGIRAPAMAAPAAPSTTVTPATSADEDPERARILAALAECAGNQTRAAKLLGIARSTLVLKLEAYRVPRPRK